MLLSIPHHILELEHVHLSPFHNDKYGKKLAKLVYKNDFIGYHLGSTMAYKLNSSNQIYWLGKVIYFKVISLVYEC